MPPFCFYAGVCQTLPSGIMKASVKVEPEPAIAASSDARPVVTVDNRIASLDGLRGIASLMVLAYHFGPNITLETSSPFYVLHRIPAFWFDGVDLFFVLSGFLISGILVDARKSPNYFKTFYARRLFRIFPLYYLVLFAYGLTIALFHVDTATRLFENPLPFWPYVLYLQNFSMAAASSFGPIWMAASWSLAVEEQFYLTLPAIIRHVDDRGLFRFAVFGLAAAPVLRALIQRFEFVPQLANYVLLPGRLDALAVGVLVMLMVRHRRQLLMTHRRWIAWGATALFLGWSLYLYVPNPQSIRLAFMNRTFTSLAFGGILLFLLVSPMSVLGRLLSTRPMRNLGNMAYSTYLFHPILLCVAFRVLRSKDPALVGLADLIPLPIAAVVTLALAWLSWSQFESRLLRVGHRFRY
jgi:peptidoglycan/LPS O-acetylase OafA/YrhL